MIRMGRSLRVLLARWSVVAVLTVGAASWAAAPAALPNDGLPLPSQVQIVADDGGATAEPAGDAAPRADRGADRPQWETQAPSQLEGEEELSMGWTLVRTLLVLGIVVMSIYVSLNFGLRRLMGIKAPMGARGAVVEVLERVALDQRRSLFVIKAANEYLLVGGADTSVQLVAKLDAAEVEKARVAAPAAPLTMSPLLKKLLGRRPGDPK